MVILVAIHFYSVPEHISVKEISNRREYSGSAKRETTISHNARPSGWGRAVLFQK